MRLSLVLSVLRPAGPVAIGVSLGFTLSLLSVTWVEEPCGPPPRPAARPPPSDGSPGGPPAGGLHNGNAARRPNAVPGGLGADSWEPRVVPYRPPSPGRAAKKAVRTRYISTELGMRQRLFVGVLTSKSTLGTLAVAVNRTLAHCLERLVYFTGTRGRKVPHGMTVVTHGDERPIWNMY